MSSRKYTGSGVGVAILDTGIYPHPDFDRRIVVFRDLVNGRRNLYDDCGHGTHVAGLLAGSGRASRGKYRGMAPGCHLAAAKVLDQRGNGHLHQVLQGLSWVCSQKERYGIRIVNISVGTVENRKRTGHLLVQAVEDAWDTGLIIVTAAGNMGPHPGSITAPGSSKKVITVGSSDLLDGGGRISGVGPTTECVCKPDVVFPGSHRIACTPGRQNGYGIKSGTSMSTPGVAGAIALLLEKDPYLTNVEVKMLLREAAVDLGYERNQQGWGLLDVDRLLKL